MPEEKRRPEAWDLGYAPKKGLENGTEGRARRSCSCSAMTELKWHNQSYGR